MAKNTKKVNEAKSPLIGNQAQPTVLGDTTKLDIDTSKILIDQIISGSLNGGLNIGELENFTSASNSRDQMYQLIDTMTADSSVAAIIRTYVEEACETADNGHVIWAESDNADINRFVNYLLNVMNADKNISNWVYSLVKYGDVYLRLYRESDYKDDLFKKQSIDKAYSAKNVLNESIIADQTNKNSIKNEELNEAINIHITGADDPYSYYVEMVDDPSTMFELTKYGKTYGYIEVPNKKLDFNIANMMTTGTTGSYAPGASVYNYKMRSDDINIYQADDFVHATLDNGGTRFPETVDIFLNNEDYISESNGQSYKVRRGSSMLADSFKVWREKSLLENSILLNRITRSSIVRKVGVEVGDMSKEQVQQTLRRVKEMFEQKSSFDANKSMTEYTNPGPAENIIYHAIHNGQGNITVDSVGGDVNVKDLADLDNWNNKFYAAYGVPKQYYGYCDDATGFNGGTSLTVLSSVFAKSVKRVQNSIIQAITDIINLILVNKGYISYLNNFTIKMKAPLTQEEISYRDNLTSRISAISNMQSLFSDIEDKSRRLTILKNLIATLNYGSEIGNEIDKEIAAIEEAKKREEKEAKKAAKNENENPEPAKNSKENEETLDLVAMPDSALEQLDTDLKTDDATTLLEDIDAALDSDDLPLPEELDANIDFSENK